MTVPTRPPGARRPAASRSTPSAAAAKAAAASAAARRVPVPPPAPADLTAPLGIDADRWQLLGLDFSSAPSRRKPVTVAVGERVRGVVRLQALLRLPTLEALAQWLRAPSGALPEAAPDGAAVPSPDRSAAEPASPTAGRSLGAGSGTVGPAGTGTDAPSAAPRPWLGGFDLPFGLPRELVETLGWPTDWAACIDHYCAQDRAALRETFAAFCAARPVGGKFAHRACDRPAGSSPSMKWVNPPVAWMLHAGVPLLRAAGWWLPAHQAQDLARAEPPGPATAAEPARPHAAAPDAPAAAPRPPAPRIALEAYPGLLARELIGARSYKADDAARQTPERLIARKDLIDALEQGRSQRLGGLRLKLGSAQREALADDASGDLLDAVQCLMQAAWALERPGWGLPADVDPLEGWIVSA